MLEASRVRPHPILMTSLAFIMGALPLVATRAGAEMLYAMGIAVFAGMGVAAFGLLRTQVVYVAVQGSCCAGRKRRLEAKSTTRPCSQPRTDGSSRCDSLLSRQDRQPFQRAPAPTTASVDT